MPADIIANNVFFYYENLEQATRFYTETLGLEVVTGLRLCQDFAGG